MTSFCMLALLLLLPARLVAEEHPLQTRVASLMAAADIPGASAAEIRGGRIVWSRGFGVRVQGAPEAVDEETVFEAASLTKPVVSVAVLRLAARGGIDLDRPLHEYRPYPDIASDERYKKITARMVLTHTTGFPNWRRGEALRIQFEPGSRFSYSGEGFVYLQRVVEQVAGKSLADLVREEVLEPLGMTRSSLVWEERFDANFAAPHAPWGRSMKKSKPGTANAAYSLHTTATDFARFLLALREGPLLGSDQRSAMLQTQVEVRDGISWGLGVGLQQGSPGRAFWHWGDNSGFKSIALLFAESGDGLVYFSNSDEGFSIVHALLAQAFGGEQPAERYLDYERHDALRRLVRLALDAAMMSGGPVRGIPKYHQLKKEHPASAFDVRLLDQIASRVLRAGFVDDAIQLLELNAREYPDSWRVHFSLGEAYVRANRPKDAMASYERALELEPSRSEVREKLQALRQAP